MYTHTPVIAKASKPETTKIVIYILAFLTALHITPATYINSTFLSQFIPSDKVGYIFAISSILVLSMYGVIKNILRKYGNYRAFLGVLMVDIASLAVMSTSLFVDDVRFAPIFIGAYIIGHVSRTLMILNLDIFLEHFSTDKDTGGIRGIYLTSLNVSFIIGPFIASYLINDTFDLGKVYIWAVVLLVPIMIIARQYLQDFKDSHYKKGKVIDILKRVSANLDLAKICSSNFILSFFYSWMIIYTPLFLESLGFSISEVVSIIGFALIPFVLLQIPIGKIADKILGEKEILTLGFLIAGVATIFMTFADSYSFWFWAGILFMTRVGASMIESMNETYLFKKINDSDIDILSLYKSISEVAYTLAPIIASILLIYVVDIKFLFVVLGIILLYGMRFSLTIRDTL